MFWVKHWCPRNSQEESFLFFFFFFLFLEQNRVVLLLQILVVCTNFAPFFFANVHMNMEFHHKGWLQSVHSWICSFRFKDFLTDSLSVGVILSKYECEKKKGLPQSESLISFRFIYYLFPPQIFNWYMCIIYLKKKKKNHLFRFVTKVYILVDKRNGMFPPPNLKEVQKMILV